MGMARAAWEGTGSGPPPPRQEEEGHLLEQCRDLDAAVVQLTKFVRQNQVSVNRILLAEQKARWVSSGRGQPPGRAGHPEAIYLPWQALAEH